MKPKTKIQKRVTELSGTLPRLTKLQEKWAFDTVLEHKAFATKASAFCLDCGRTFSLELITRKKATCPHCDTKVTVTKTNKRTFKQISYFAICYTVEEFQVVANFEIIAQYKKSQCARVNVTRIVEHWIKPDGSCVTIGLLHNTSWYCDNWTGEFEIRAAGGADDRYSVYQRAFHPSSKFTPQLKKLGVNRFMSGISVAEAARLLPKYPKLETLLKAKQYSLLGYAADHLDNVSRFWRTIRICLRNKYKVKDARTWFDYVQLLDNDGKDLLNAKYVCPKNLKAEHDRVLARIERVRRERKEKEQLAMIAQSEAAYAERIKNLMGFHFADGGIVIKVLESVKEFQEEGSLLKHCVFAGEYYKKKGSLIFSARLEGVPIETIELSIPGFKIIQARGLGNAPSEYNKKIVSLVEKNIPRIKKAWKGKLHTA